MKRIGGKVLVGLIVLSYLVVFTAVSVAQSTYVVQPGDTLYRIAIRHGTSVAALQAANNISNVNLIYAGQVLTIPGGGSAPPVATAVPPPPNPYPTAPPPGSPPTIGTFYVVQPGDRLYRIALQFGVTVQAIASANNIANTNLIYAGQVLIIPGSNSGAPPVATAVPPTNPTAPPPPAAPPSAGTNLFSNGSFEGGWYHAGNVPELQIPTGWVFEWDEGPTGFGSTPWDVWFRPEVRVLPAFQLPPHEQNLFIFDGNQTVKVFKGNGAISYRLFQDVMLTPGTYRLTAGAFPDLVSDYVNGQKIRPSDPAAGEVRFIVGGGGTGWLAVTFGQQNTLTHTFTINQTQTVRLGLAVRGRYALNNNGWFLDGWSLVKIQ